MLGFGHGIWNAALRNQRGEPAAHISITNLTVAENTAIDTLFGVLSVANGSGSYPFSITTNTYFKLSGGDDTQVLIKAAPNYEVAPSPQFEITADNGIDDPIVRTFDAIVTNVLEVSLNNLTLSADEIEEGTSGAV